MKLRTRAFLTTILTIPISYALLSFHLIPLLFFILLLIAVWQDVLEAKK